jgi:hypothetical protein
MVTSGITDPDNRNGKDLLKRIVSMLTKMIFRDNNEE